MFSIKLLLIGKFIAMCDILSTQIIHISIFNFSGILNRLKNKYLVSIKVPVLFISQHFHIDKGVDLFP